jgi:hypothetical protein
MFSINTDAFGSFPTNVSVHNNSRKYRFILKKMIKAQIVWNRIALNAQAQPQRYYLLNKLPCTLSYHGDDAILRSLTSPNFGALKPRSL